MPIQRFEEKRLEECVGEEEREREREIDQYFGYPMRRTDSFEKTLMLGKIEGRRRRG